MKLILDNIYDEELKEFLLLQEGILNVDIKKEGFFNVFDIDYDDNTTAYIIYKYIQLFEKDKFPLMIEFDKKESYETKVLKYNIEDLCCEYCFKSFIEYLFENDNIKSVTSTYEFNEPLFDIDFSIEYNKDYSEEELIEYIKKEL